MAIFFVDGMHMISSKQLLIFYIIDGLLFKNGQYILKEVCLAAYIINNKLLIG